MLELASTLRPAETGGFLTAVVFISIISIGMIAFSVWKMPDNEGDAMPKDEKPGHGPGNRDGSHRIADALEMIADSLEAIAQSLGGTGVDADTKARLARIESKLDQVLAGQAQSKLREEAMANAGEIILAEVQENSTAVGSIQALLDQLVSGNVISEETKTAIVSALNSDQDKLAAIEAALRANVPPAPPPAEPPTA